MLRSPAMLSPRSFPLSATVSVALAEDNAMTYNTVTGLAVVMAAAAVVFMYFKDRV
jgi:hypothetical protein